VRARYITDPSGRIDPEDRGLAYGDGLFETMSVRTGSVERLRLHLDRLGEGARRLRLALPDADELEARILEAATGLARGTLKLILTRGTGPRGYAPPADSSPTVVLLTYPGAACDPASEIAVTTLGMRLAENENLAGIKHLNRLEQVLGRVELSATDADEGLMLSTSGKVIGGTSRNLFAVFGSRIVTPDLRLCGIAGVMRRSVLEACPDLGIDVAIDALDRSDLDRADELFMTNAIVGIQSVSTLDGRQLADRHIAGRLREALGLTGTGQADGSRDA